MSFFLHDNIKINYSVEGDGKAVVLVHGFGEDSTIWNEQVHFLRSFCKVITFDLPGSGRSPLSKDGLTIENFAEIIVTLCKELKEENIILFGHSMGGYISLAFAEKHPAMLSAWGLIHSTAFADSEEKKQTRRKGIEFIRKNGAYSFLKTSTPNLFSERSKQTMPETVNALIEKGKQFTAEALTGYYEAMIERPDRTAVLASSEQPVLFILGTEDAAAPLNDVLQQVHLPGITEIHITENVAHMSMLEAPETLNAHLMKFINEIVK